MTRTTKALVMLAAAVSLAVLVFPAAKEKTIDSAWAAAPVKIDGQVQDWPSAEFLTDGGSKAKYAVRNDGRNLYVAFVFESPEAASTVEATGLKVFFNAAGKKSKDLGVQFVKKSVSADGLIDHLEKQGEALTEARKAEIRQKKEYALFEADVINPKKYPAPSDPAVTSEPPVFYALRNQGRNLVYELRLPLGRTNQPGGLGAGPGQTVKLGFEWGGLTKEMKAEMMGPRGISGVNPGLDQGVGREREDSASGGGAVLRHDPRTRQHAFWIDVKLAAQ